MKPPARDKSSDASTPTRKDFRNGISLEISSSATNTPVEKTSVD